MEQITSPDLILASALTRSWARLPSILPAADSNMEKEMQGTGLPHAVWWREHGDGALHLSPSLWVFSPRALSTSWEKKVRSKGGSYGNNMRMLTHAVCATWKYFGFFSLFFPLYLQRELHYSCQPRPVCTLLISSSRLHKLNFSSPWRRKDTTSPLLLDHLELGSMVGF